MAKSIRHFDVTGDAENSLFCCQFSRDDEFIATSDIHGKIRIASAKTGQNSPFILNVSDRRLVEIREGNLATKSEWDSVDFARSSLSSFHASASLISPQANAQLENLPIVALQWRPETGSVSQKKVITAVRTDGWYQQFHAVTGKSLATVDVYADKRDSTSDHMPGLLCMDYNHDGKGRT